MAWQRREWYEKFTFYPYDMHRSKTYYRFVSYGLLHADWMHLGVNMFVLLSFGNQMLKTYLMFFGFKGYLYFLLLYIGGLVFSVLFLFLIPIGIPAVLFGVLYIAFEAYMHKRAKDNIGHDVHIGGAIFGLGINILLNPSVVSHFFSQIF